MTNKELQAKLKEFPNDMEVTVDTTTHCGGEYDNRVISKVSQEDNDYAENGEHKEFVVIW